MKCSRCGQENPPHAKFCLECAAPLALRCDHCGTQLPPAAKFCFECATPVGGSARPRPTPQQYTPQHLVERILTSRGAMEGERKFVTVLFADMKGSTALLAGRDPEEARQLLDPVLAQMMDAVHRYEGTVNQVMGDGIMALFGAPIAHEDHSVRACYAALHMHNTVKAYAEEVQRSHGVTVQIRVGLNAGEVVLRSIGSDLHMDYTAVGETTHLAARMEQAAMPGSTLVTNNVVRLAQEFISVTSIGMLTMKGIAEPVEAYQLVGAGAARTRLQAMVGRGLTRFVGRDLEVDELRRASEKARRGEGQVVAIVGEPGIGKSRLFYEFTRAERPDGWMLLETGGTSYGKATAYLPLIELFKAYFSLDPRDDARRIRDALTARLAAVDDALLAALPAFLSLFDVPVDDPRWTALDPPRRRQRTLEALKRLLLLESRRRPMMLLFEDLHWVDSETQVFLDNLVESIPAVPILLLVNYRPEYRHAWGHKTYYRQLQVAPLVTESANALLTALLGEDSQLEPLRHLLIQRTDGSPFFLEESVRTLVETGVLTGGSGAYRLDRRLGDVQVPSTVQSMLAARLDRLAPEDKSLLQMASVIGKDVPIALLEAIADVAPEDVQRRLDALRAAEFLYETSLFPEREYTFKHALTHDVAYRSLLKRTRQQHHRRIVETLVGRFPDTVESRPEIVAHHCTEAGLADEAVRQWLRAGQRARERFANVEAAGHLARGLEIIGALESAERDERELDLQIGLAQTIHALKGQAAPEVERAYARARELCEKVSNTQQLFRVLLGLYRFYGARGQAATAWELIEQLFALAERSGDDHLRLEAYMARGTLLMSRGELLDARDHLDVAIRLYDVERHRSHVLRYGIDPGVNSMSRSSWVLWYLGYANQAVSRSEQALALAGAREEPYTLAMALCFAGMLHQFRREPALVRRCADSAWQTATKYDIKQWEIGARFLLGWSRWADGDIDTGLAEMQQAFDVFHAAGISLYRAWYLGVLAEACTAAGRMESARSAIGEALTIDSADAMTRLNLLCIKADIVARAPDAEGADREAEALLREALMVARSHQGKSLELRAAVNLLRLLDRLGRGGEGRAILRATYDWFTEGFDTSLLVEARALLESR